MSVNRVIMQRAAAYAARHLQTIAEDMGDGGYTQKDRNDMHLAIAMLKAAPDAFTALDRLCGSRYPEFLPRYALEQGRNALARALDREQGRLL